ncbi:uncharacterized protein LOC135673956 [Musa acuminata AAA Group]|uniref:uncharacterized protein LOC135673956 n=1 Tax=Musa acuminata AAA Group TaxID=214697 RepID=UPI0031E2129C
MEHQAILIKFEKRSRIFGFQNGVCRAVTKPCASPATIKAAELVFAHGRIRTLAAFTRASWGRASDRRNNSTGTSDPFRSQWRTTLIYIRRARERRKLLLSTRIDSSVKCFLERTLSSLCSEIPSVSGTSLEASKMEEKGVVDATILIWSAGVGGTSLEASKMKETGVVDTTVHLKYECLISHQPTTPPPTNDCPQVDSQRVLMDARNIM